MVAHIEAGDLQPRGHGRGRQGQADIAEAEDDEIADSADWLLGNRCWVRGCGIHFVVTLAFIS
ncbi:hypothetical protein [Nocardiopsis sp. ATB16-24]|uniref:hypothetical protein n=1 Tax=Nocardiopsis sp. ATB16-24 TaxID=3019555 RepID=UPI0025529919|nr:hypothetical protein [Nocardiopsis sp. ATB16-24]